MQHPDSPAVPPAAAPAPAGPARRGPRRRTVATAGAAALVTGGLVVAALGSGGGTTATPTVPGDREPLANTQDVAYSTFTDCSALLGYYRTQARRLVGPYGLPGTGGIMFDTVGGGTAMASRAAAGPMPAAPQAADGAQTGTSAQTGTNVQVAGVDEADVAKRVGDLLYSAAYSETVARTDPDGTKQPALTIVRTTGGKAALLGRLELKGWQPQSLLVDGTTVLLVGSAPWQPDVAAAESGVARRDARIMPYGYFQRTRLVQVDVADPAAPRVVRTLDVDGSQIGTRLVDGVARVTVSGSTQRLRFVSPAYPQPDQPLTRSGVVDPDAPVVAPPFDESAVKKAEKKATATNRTVVARSAIEDWLPRYELVEGAGSKPTSSGNLLSCNDIAKPAAFSGLDTMAMLTFDLRDRAGISRWNGGGLVASGAQLYATADHTYVATTPWQDWAAWSPAEQLRRMKAQRSRIFLFDTTGGASPVYVGSGQVPGFLLNQFAMDEKDGYLRVASTTTPQWWGGEQTRDTSTSQVTVLRVGEDALPTVGSVGGLGKGEQIRAVRFLGDVGYVVTFRQTDPLYTIDLSTPADPRVTGELKILGYSSYLHPVGDGLVLGVGQDATAKGQVRGLQMALFDVSDPAAPRRVDKVTLPGAWSDVEGDHHAFTFTDGLALVPYTQYTDPGQPAAPAVEDGGDGSGTSASGGTTTDPAARAGYPTVDAGVVAVRIDGTGTGSRFTPPVVLRPVGNGPVVMDDTGAGLPQPLRTFVGDGSVWTVTTGGISAHDLGTLRRTGFTKL